MEKYIVGFDFDGTIGNSYELYSRCYQYLFNKYSSPLTLADLPSYYGYTEYGMLKRMFPSENSKVIYREYLEMYEKLHSMYFPSLEKGMNELLTLLAKKEGVSLVMVTGRGKESVDYSLRFFKVDSLFKKIYLGSDDYKDTKEQAFKKCLSDFKIPKSHMLYIGDAKMDIISSSKAEIKSCLVTYENKDINCNIIGLKPDYLAASVNKLKEKILAFLSKEEK